MHPQLARGVEMTLRHIPRCLGFKCLQKLLLLKTQAVRQFRQDSDISHISLFYIESGLHRPKKSEDRFRAEHRSDNDGAARGFGVVNESVRHRALELERLSRYAVHRPPMTEDILPLGGRERVARPWP